MKIPIPSFFKLLLLIPFILMIIWFGSGLITGGGEEGILFYNTSKTLQLSTSVWIDYMAGISNLNWLPRAPVIYLSYLFEKSGIPLFIFQMILFYTLMVTGVVSVYYLTKNLLHNHINKNLISFTSALFYLFNPFCFSQVWGRSLSTQYFAFALLPLGLLLFYLGLTKKKYIFGLLVAVTAVFFSWAHGLSTFIIVYWVSILTYLLFHIFTSESKTDEIIFGIKFTALTVILWCFFNSWWFIPLVFSYTSVYTAVISGESENLGSLISVSKSYPLEIIVRLLHKGYFFDASAYSPVYSTLIFQLISFIPFLFILVGLIKSIKTKLINVRFFSLLLILGLVVSLGANPPFGDVFVWFFKHLNVIQAFRNPFEKFGLVYALGYSVIFAYGLIIFMEKKKFKELIISLVLILTCGIYAWPMWTGKVIASPDSKIGLDIPAYYEDLRQWLKSEGGDFRLLMTPVWAGDGAYYNWGRGGRYQGIDPMIFMLDQPPISNNSRAPYFGDFLSSIRKNMERVDVTSAISLLRTKYLIDRKDAIIISDREKGQYKFLTSSIYPPLGIESNLKTICPEMVADSSLNDTAWIVCNIKKEDSDFSNIRYLHVKIKTNVPATIELVLRDTKEIKIRWDGRHDAEYSTDSDNWQYLTIPLGNPTEINYEIDFSKIAILEVLAHPKDNALASVWKIDISGIKLDSGMQTETERYKKKAEFGNLSVFEPINFNPPPEFGSLLEVEKVGDFTVLFDETGKKKDKINVTGFILPSQNLNKDLAKLDGEVSLQVLDKQKISETRYWIRMGKGEGYGLVILSTRFDPQWKILPGVSRDELKGGLISDLKLLRRSALSEDNHFVVNGYANLWRIDEGLSDEYVIVFLPQIIADISLKISIFSVLFVIGFLLLWIIKKYIFLR